MNPYGKLQRLGLGCVAIMIACPTFVANASTADTEKITQDEPIRSTQQLEDSIARGDQTPWQTWFAEDAIYTGRQP